MPDAKVGRARLMHSIPLGATESSSLVADRDKITMTRTDGGLRIEQAKRKPLWVPAANIRWIEYE